MSLAAAYAAKKKSKMAKGGVVCGDESGSSMTNDIVDRVMAKKYSKGGMVANDTDPSADALPNEFDDLVLRDDLESSYTGKDSGDELGNAQMDDDNDDIVSRVMRSRKLKDKMPRPA